MSRSVDSGFITLIAILAGLGYLLRLVGQLTLGTESVSGLVVVGRVVDALSGWAGMTLVVGLPIAVVKLLLRQRFPAVDTAVLRGAVLALLLSILIGVAAMAMAGSARSSAGASGPAPPGVAHQPASKGDLLAFGRLGDLTGSWNRAAAPLIRDYLDPTVSAEAWVLGARTHLAQLRTVVTEMNLAASLIGDPGLRATAKTVSDVYQSKLSIMTRIHAAVARGDEAAETAALEDLDKANARGLAVAQSVIDSVRPYLTTAEVDQVLKAFGANSRDLGRRMEPTP